MSWIFSEDAFAAWAPDGVVWSQWAKPIAFINPDGGVDANGLDESLLPALPEDLEVGSAVIVDLPGAEAVYAGMTLVGRGFRPVPLFNGTSGPSPVIDVVPITTALASCIDRLKRSTLRLDAAPAFLLDARRFANGAVYPLGAYDNRWLALPHDFPSAALLGSKGIARATLVQRGGLTAAKDLAHVLRRWQDGGLTIRIVDLDSGRSENDVSIPKPSGFRWAWYAAIALFGFRRSNVGGFGSTIPDYTENGGGFG